MKRLLGLLLVALFAGCATTPKIDWKTRVGTYSYDEAISELGVPDRSATLSDGTVVGEWLRRRGTTYLGVNDFPGSHLHTYDLNRFPDNYLRLVFGPDRKLVRAENFVK